MAGFDIYNERSAGDEVTESLPATPGVQYLPSCGLKLVNGQVALVTATDKMSHVYQTLETRPEVLRPATFDLASATLPQTAITVPVQGRDVFLKSAISGTYAPPILNLACNTNSTTTVVVATFGGGAGDFTGGTIYSPDYDQHRRITGDAFGGGIHTFTLDAPFTKGTSSTTAVALTTGNTITAVPVAAGSTGVKFKDSQGLDMSVAGKSGGNNKIEAVDLKNLFVISSCPYLS